MQLTSPNTTETFSLMPVDVFSCSFLTTLVYFVPPSNTVMWHQSTLEACILLTFSARQVSCARISMNYFWKYCSTSGLHKYTWKQSFLSDAIGSHRCRFAEWYLLDGLFSFAMRLGSVFTTAKYNEQKGCFHERILNCECCQSVCSWATKPMSGLCL